MEIFRNNWLEITKGWNFSYKLSDHGEHYCLIFTLIYFTFYISFPEKEQWSYSDKSWGVYYHMRSFNFNWGEKHYWLRMPFDWEINSHEIMDKDGNFIDYDSDKHLCTEDREKEKVYVLETYYTYKRRNGEIQKAWAKATVERRVFKWYWFQWLPFPKKVYTSLWVEFDREMGEKTGTWKGGVVGCGIDMLPTETPIDALRRMEKTREL